MDVGVETRVDLAATPKIENDKKEEERALTPAHVHVMYLMHAPEILRHSRAHASRVSRAGSVQIIRLKLGTGFAMEAIECKSTR